MYSSFYQINRPAFLLTPDPRFLHLANPHRNALCGLIESILKRKGFVVLTGPVGTGKTTLLNAALTGLQRMETRPVKPIAKVLTAFIVNPTLTRDEFLETILDEFEITCASASKPRRLLALHERLLRVQEQGGTAILVIDEAHLLTIELLEEIRLLANIETYNGKLLQIILCGQPEFASLLLQPQLTALRQRIAFLARLRPLNEIESNAYIEQRLSAAGLNGPNPFSALALCEIYKASQGVPRLINLLCEAALTVGQEKKRLQIEPDIIREAAVRLSTLDVLAAPTAVPAKAAAAFTPVLNKSVAEQRTVNQINTVGNNK